MPKISGQSKAGIHVVIMSEEQQLAPIVGTHVQDVALVDELLMNGSNGLPLRVEQWGVGSWEWISRGCLRNALIVHSTFMLLCSIGMRPP